MKKNCDVVVVMPVGPNCNLDFVGDTIQSVYSYLACSFEIVIIDDSQAKDGEKLKEKFPLLDVIATPKSMGRYAGLFLTLCQAYKHALDHYHFTAIFKVDTDALVIGSEPEQEALALFSSHPDAGMAGQYGRQYNGEPWDIIWPKARILNGTTTWKFIKRPVSNWILRKLYKQALQHGYKAGESVFGGSYFMSEKCLQKMDEKGWLHLSSLLKANLEEDHIFSLLTKAAGFTLTDLSADKLPFALAWKGLPDAPENLLKNGKKIIHSTRKWKEMDEAQVRQYYLQYRNEKDKVN